MRGSARSASARTVWLYVPMPSSATSISAACKCEPTNCSIHSLTTCVSASLIATEGAGAGARAASLMRISNAISIQLAISDDPPAARNGVVRAGDRQQLDDTTDDNEHLNRKRCGKAGREQLAEAVTYRHRGTETARDDDGVQEQDREEAGQPELLADRRHDEVALRERHRLRATLTQTGAENATGREAVQRLHDLVGGVAGIAERIDPDRDARSARD